MRFASDTIFIRAAFSEFFTSSSTVNCLDKATIVSKSMSSTHFRVAVLWDAVVSGDSFRIRADVACCLVNSEI